MTSPLAGLAKTVGKAFAGIFFDCVLTRYVPADSPDPADPLPPIAQTFTCKAIAQDYSAGIRGQGLVGATDMNALILAASLKTQPQPGDQIVIASQGFSGTIAAGGAAGMKAVTTDPAKACWQCRTVT